MAKGDTGWWKKWAKSVTAPWSGGSELIEIRQAILDEVAGRVTAVGGGQRIFPFNHLELHVHAGTEEQRIMTAAAVAAWDLPTTIRERLGAVGCAVEELTVELVLEAKKLGALRERPFFLEYQQVKRRAKSDEPPELVLTVLKGKTAKPVQRFRRRRVLIGRTALALDETGAPKRRNDLVFDDEGEANATVSRAHARIDYRPAERCYTVTDERSAYGTKIFRNGREIPVPSRDKHGVRLQSGDLVSFGLAEVKCTIKPPVDPEAEG